MSSNVWRPPDVVDDHPTRAGEREENGSVIENVENEQKTIVKKTIKMYQK